MQQPFASHARFLKKIGQLIILILVAGTVISLVYVKSSWAGNPAAPLQLRKPTAVLPGPIPFVVTPDSPPQKVQVFCCTADGACTPVNGLTSCGPGDILTVCDTTETESICIPVGQINMKPYLKKR